MDADVRLTYDGTDWKPSVTATCRGISLTDTQKFPYWVEQTTGQVTYHPAANGKADELHLDLTGIGGGRPIKIEADLSHLTPGEPLGPAMGEGVASVDLLDANGEHAAGFRGVRYARAEPSTPIHPLGYVDISGSDVPLHDQLLDALPPKAQDFVRKLQGQGTIDFHFRAEWKNLSQRHAEVTQDIRLKDCRIRFEPFPFPLQNVQGLVTERNSQWMVNDVEARGSSNSTIVKCRGGVVPHDSGFEADLTFEATNVPLDENLKLALTPAGLRAWDEMKPQGSIDFTAHVTRQPNDIEPNVEVTLRPRGHTVSIEPRMFPYRLEELQGTATYKRGRVDWRSVRAQHDRSICTMDAGTWQAAADGGWQCNFANVNVDRLTMSRDLVAALPPPVQAVVDKLQPSGTIGLYNGRFSFAKSPQNPALASTWDFSLECQQSAIQGAMPMQGINGGIRLFGHSDGHNAYSAGELALDSVICKESQLTNIRGPFWADATRCLIGEPACEQQSQPPRRLVADAYGGTLATNIELLHGTIPSYKIDMHLGGASLGRFVNERLGGPHDMNGTVSGTLSVSGTGTSVQTLHGSGELHVVDANIYQLPLLVAMLKVLRNRTPDSTAFNRCDMQFDIQGEHIRFKQLNLMGDAVSLYGRGETDFNRRLDLEFDTLIGPADLPIPFVKWFAGNVSKQGLQLKVVGTLDNPKTEKKPFPGINDMLNQLQTDIHEGAATMTPVTVTRGTRQSLK